MNSGAFLTPYPFNVMFKSLVDHFVSWKEKIGGEKLPPIEIFVRHCNYSAASAHKARFAGFSKERCFDNLLETLEGQTGINLTLFLDTHYPMEGAHFVHKQERYPVIEIKAGSEAASFLHMLEHVARQKFSPDTIIYFLEDDYLHKPEWPGVLREAFTLSGIHYATLFDHKDKYFFPQYAELKSKIFHTATCHWRTTPSTTNTYVMRFKTLKEHIDLHRIYSLGRTITADHDKFTKLAEEGAVLISSIPGYSTHAEPEFASPCTDWENFFSQNAFKKNARLAKLDHQETAH